MAGWDHNERRELPAVSAFSEDLEALCTTKPGTAGRPPQGHTPAQALAPPEIWDYMSRAEC
jgi:hypothetical protein